MAGQVLALVGDALVIGAMLVFTVGVIGLVRLPTLGLKLHAAGMLVVLGGVALALMSLTTGNAAIATRGSLVAVLLLLTTPVAAHAIAHAAWHRGDLVSEEETTLIPEIGDR